MATLKATEQGIEFYSQYDAGLVLGVKALPYQDRKWVPDKKCWLVANQHKGKLIELCEEHLGETPHIQGTFTQLNQPTQKLFRIEYIGAPKDRGEGELIALGAIGNVDLEWSVLFREMVLREFFEGENARTSIVLTTHYSTLAIKQVATQDEIKASYRKMLRRYHPDVNKDDDAADITKKIIRAYEVLSSPQMRKKYDAGLHYEQTVIGGNSYDPNAKYWRPPLRNGLVLCAGKYSAGFFVVDKILRWDDIVENGRTLVASWDKDSNSLVRSWM